jgi:DNA-directed RNA polymerase
MSAFALVESIGAAVEQEYRVKQLDSKTLRKARLYQNTLISNNQMKKDYGRFQKMLNNGTLFQNVTRNEESLQHVDLMQKDWEATTRVRVGSALTALLLKTAAVPLDPVTLTFKCLQNSERSVLKEALEWQPAFSHEYIRRNGKQIGVISVHTALAHILQEGVKGTAERKGFWMPKLLPMIVPPQPWLSYDSGGYLTIKSTYSFNSGR